MEPTVTASVESDALKTEHHLVVRITGAEPVDGPVWSRGTVTPQTAIVRFIRHFSGAREVTVQLYGPCQGPWANRPFGTPVYWWPQVPAEERQSGARHMSDLPRALAAAIEAATGEPLTPDAAALRDDDRG